MLYQQTFITSQMIIQLRKLAKINFIATTKGAHLGHSQFTEKHMVRTAEHKVEIFLQQGFWQW